MKRILKNTVLYLLILLLPFAVFITAAENTKNLYVDSFTASLSDKYDRLYSLEGQKLVIIGGSSVPFGIRSDLIEKELKLNVVDYGVYASLGTKVMLDTAKDAAAAGDIVIIAPELNEQTYSLYFNPEILWEAVSDNRGIINRLSFSEKIEMAYYYFAFSVNRIKLRNSESPAGTLYSRSAFNEYGDIFYPRKSNIMPGGYDGNQTVSLENLRDEAFFSYLDDYCRELSDRGVDVFFSFSPVNRLAAGYGSEEEIGFLSCIEENLDCELLGTPSEMTYGAEYFYNTNFHLNDSGAVLHTVNIINLLKDKLGIKTPTDITVPTPPPINSGKEEIFEAESDDGDANALYFVYKREGGAVYISSVRDEYRDVTSLTLPKTIGGEAVTGLLSECFSGCGKLTEIHIPDGYNMFSVRNFSGCPSLERVYIGVSDPSTAFVPSSALMEGAENVKLYIPEADYFRFIGDYSWRIYREYFVKYGG